MLEMQPGPGLPDGIAREVMYHHSCYKIYTHANTLSRMMDSQILLEDERCCSSAYDSAFVRLVTEVQSTILDKTGEGTIGRVPDLCSRFVALLQEEGVSVVDYRTSKLRRRLQKHFGDKLLFFRNSRFLTDPEMVTSASVPQKVLLEYVAVALHKEPDHLEDTEGTDSDNFESFASDATVHEAC